MQNTDRPSPMTDHQAQPDTRLHDAAHDLYVVLLEAVGHHDPHPHGYDAIAVAMNEAWRERARAALRKAGWQS